MYDAELRRRVGVYPDAMRLIFRKVAGVLSAFGGVFRSPAVERLTMAAIKLERLPDRTPVKIMIAISPDLNRALGDYAGAYEAAYGQAELVAELIPAMLSAFLQSNRGFVRGRRSRDGTS